MPAKVILRSEPVAFPAMIDNLNVTSLWEILDASVQTSTDSPSIILFVLALSETSTSGLENGKIQQDNNRWCS